MTFNGWVDNGGGFMMFGTYNFAIEGVTPPMFQCCIVGKVTFKMGTFDPTKISGNLFMMSPITGDVMTLKFRTTKNVTP